MHCQRIHGKNTCTCKILSPSGYTYIVALGGAFIAYIWHGCAVGWLKAALLCLVHYASLLSCCTATFMTPCHYICCIYAVLPPSYCFATVVLLWRYHAVFPLWHSFAPCDAIFFTARLLCFCFASVLLFFFCHAALATFFHSDAALPLISWLKVLTTALCYVYMYKASSIAFCGEPIRFSSVIIPYSMHVHMFNLYDTMHCTYTCNSYTLFCKTVLTWSSHIPWCVHCASINIHHFAVCFVGQSWHVYCLWAALLHCSCMAIVMLLLPLPSVILAW